MSTKITLFGIVVVVVCGVAIVQHVGDSLEEQTIRPPTADERAELRRLGRFALTRGYGLVSTIVAIRWDGSGERRLGRGRDPSWSPDGRRIAFSRFGDEHVFVMRANGDAVHRLARGTSPDWSPDGRRIAFGRTEGPIGRQRSAIWVMWSDGSGQRRLWLGANPSWSPDGRRIAFDRGDAILHGETLWVGEPGGGAPKRLTDAWDPAWSPDGDWILASTDQEEEGLFTQPSELALVDPDSGDLDPERALAAVEDLGDLPLELFPSLPLRFRAWELRDSLSAAEATFVALAEHLGEPLATKDQALAAAARAHSRAAVIELHG